MLQCRAAEEDRPLAAQGLVDLVGAHGAVASLLDSSLPLPERAGMLRDHLERLAARGPVVLAVDDVPWLDDVSLRLLRFCLRRMTSARLSLLATARTPGPLAPEGRGVPDLGIEPERLEVSSMPARDLAQLVARTCSGISGARARQIGRLAHGNPLFALELARRGTTGVSGSGSAMTLLGALRERIEELPPPALHLARLLAAAGPVPIAVLRAASGTETIEPALHDAVAADVLSIGDDFVVRFAHPLLTTAVLDGVTALDRRTLHAALADAVDDPIARVVHLARAAIEADAGIAGDLEGAADRLLRRGAPRRAAELLADSVRLTPVDDVGSRTRRVLAHMRACATGGDLSSALALADDLLAELPPGELRAQVIACRVELDHVDAEQFLRASIAELSDDGGPPGRALLRGRLLGLLGWMLALHLARLPEGIEAARAGLVIGRAHGDALLTAQAAATISTASLMAGVREDALIDEAVGLDADVPARHLVMWPRVLLARQQLWDGHLADARYNHESMYRRSVGLGAELQRSYRLCDLAQVELAAGNLDLAGSYLDDGVDAAVESADRRAATWLAYPAGQLAALRGERAAAVDHADMLDRWASGVGDRPRSAMAGHIRGTLAASDRDWDAALGHLLGAVEVLDRLGVAHPGVVPVLPQALLCAVLAERDDKVGDLADRLHRAATALRSPWVRAQAQAAVGLRAWVDDEDAVETLIAAWSRLSALGYRLDAARLGCAVVAAGLRWGRRRQVRAIAGDAVATFSRERVAGWQALAAELRDRALGTGHATELTTTEAQIAELVAAGHRNREIAAELFIGVSTVEAHLTRIYRKLGLRNRAELVRMLQQPGA